MSNRYFENWIAVSCWAQKGDHHNFEKLPDELYMAGGALTSVFGLRVQDLGRTSSRL